MAEYREKILLIKNGHVAWFQLWKTLVAGGLKVRAELPIIAMGYPRESPISA